VTWSVPSGCNALAKSIISNTDSDFSSESLRNKSTMPAISRRNFSSAFGVRLAMISA
jgi:hypothetical protein